MRVSAQHRILLQGPRAEMLFGETEVLVAALHLCGRMGIRQELSFGVDYIHVMFESHQILRSDGTGHDKASYLAALPRHMVRPKFSDIVATGDGSVMVVRYRIETNQVIDGKAVTGVSPRLSVFRKDGGRWLISAHANFAALG